MPDQTPEPPLQSDAALAELRARLASDGTLAPVPEELAPLCPVCLCGVVDDVVDLDDGSLIHGECMPVDVMIRQINTERDESARLRARIAELEAAQANPDAYIAVKRCGDFPNADRPDWFADARVLHPGAPHFEADRAEYVRNGFDLLPIVGTETGTRPATAQPVPAGYVVVTRNSEGGLHRSATAWDDLERATAAGDFQARHADGTGCTAAVYELREVRGA